MKAVLVRDPGERYSLEWGDAPLPRAGEGEVLVDVAATAVNRADLLQVRGRYPPPPGVTDIPGLEVAGRVRENGKRLRAGDRVCALLPGGGYAERVAVPEGMLLRIPDTLSFEEAAALPEAFYTAFLNLFLEAGLGEGERVLVHAGASGVGSAALQLAKRAGAEVFATAGGAEKLQFCREVGADVVVDYKAEDFSEALAKAAPGGVDVILDCVGGSYLEKNVRLLRKGGRMVVIGLLGGASGKLELGVLLSKGLRIIGSTLRSRPVEEKLRLTEAFEERVWPAFERGELRPIVDRVFPIEAVDEAHQYMLENRNRGKIVLKVGAVE